MRNGVFPALIGPMTSIVLDSRSRWPLCRMARRGLVASAPPGNQHHRKAADTESHEEGPEHSGSRVSGRIHNTLGDSRQKQSFVEQHKRKSNPGDAAP